MDIIVTKTGAGLCKGCRMLRTEIATSLPTNFSTVGEWSEKLTYRFNWQAKRSKGASERILSNSRKLTVLMSKFDYSVETGVEAYGMTCWWFIKVLEFNYICRSSYRCFSWWPDEKSSRWRSLKSNCWDLVLKKLSHLLVQLEHHELWNSSAALSGLTEGGRVYASKARAWTRPQTNVDSIKNSKEWDRSVKYCYGDFGAKSATNGWCYQTWSAKFWRFRKNSTRICWFGFKHIWSHLQTQLTKFRQLKFSCWLCLNSVASIADTLAPVFEMLVVCKTSSEWFR